MEETNHGETVAEIVTHLVSSLRSLELAPTRIPIGRVRLGAWQIHAVPTPTDFPGYDAYIIRVPYTLMATKGEAKPTVAEIGFTLLDSAVISDAVPRSTRTPEPARRYELTPQFNFNPVHENSSRAGPVDVVIPNVEPIIEVFGIGSTQIRFRHTDFESGVLLGSHLAWLALLVPAGQQDLRVQAHAHYTPPDDLGMSVQGEDAEFPVVLSPLTPSQTPSQPLTGTEPADRVLLKVGFVFDIVNSSARTEPEQRALQERVVTLIDAILSDINVTPGDEQRQTTGDGMHVFLPTDIDVSQVVPNLLRSTTQRLADDNQQQTDHMRLRMAVGFGPVGVGSLGFTGPTVGEFARLVDSTPLREAIHQHPDADLAVLISDRIHEFAIRPRYTHINPTAFRQVHAEAKEFAANAWLWLPAPPLPR